MENIEGINKKEISVVIPCLALFAYSVLSDHKFCRSLLALT
jgi:hypothetical protein